MGYRISFYRMEPVQIEAGNLPVLASEIPDTYKDDWRTRQPWPATADGMAGLLEDIGFSTEIDGTGDILISGWYGEKQPWEWSEILRAIAKAAPSADSTWVIIGEDEYIWAEVFKDGTVTSEDVEIVVAGRVLS